MTDIVLQWGDTRRIQVDNDFGNESEGYHVTVEGYSGDAGRYCYWS